MMVYRKLRSQIMRALKCDRAGANLVVRLAFACGLSTDPLYVDAWKTFLASFACFSSVMWFSATGLPILFGFARPPYFGAFCQVSAAVGLA